MVYRRRVLIGGIAYRIERLTILKRGPHPEMRRRPVLAAHVFQHTDGGFERTLRVRLQPFGQRQQKDHLTVSGTLAVTIQFIRYQHIRPAAKILEPADLTVMHKGPAANSKRLAIVAAGGRSG